jgi:putative ATP-binding cassette transporter
LIQLMKVFAVLRRYSPLPVILFATLLGVASGGSNTALIVVINRTLSGSHPITAGWIWTFAGLCLLAAVARISSSSILVGLGARTANEIQLQLGRRILKAPLRQLEEVGSHRLMASLVDDVQTVAETMTMVPNTFINLTIVVGCLVYMGRLSPRLLVLVGIAMVLGVLSYNYATRKGIVRQRKARDRGDELFDHLRGLVEGTKELKIRRQRRQEFISILRDAAVEFRGLRVTAQRIFIAAASWGNLLFFVVIGLVLFLVPQLTDLTREARNGYVLILLYMSGPLQIVLNVMPLISQASVAIQKIERLGISLLDEAEDAGDEDLAPTWSTLQLDGVKHTYYREEEGSFTLGPVDLTFHPGELVFLTGGNGSGKTTLAKLLIGLYVPEDGEIRLNGETVGPDRLDSYRQLFGVVFSDFFLFEKLLGLDSPELDSRARLYLERLRLAHRVVVEKGRLSTIDLSQGQRKRLALLIAYLEDCPIFLFDEWAADQDPEFKEVFYHQLLPELKARGKTVFVISHDDRYYDVADRLVKLDYGQVVADRRAAQIEEVHA